MNLLRLHTPEPEFPGTLDDKCLGFLRFAAQVFDIKNQHITHTGVLAAWCIQFNLS
jgi:hypothetical protein